MRPWIVALVLLAACTSAEEKEKQRQAAMMEAAIADSVEEAEFVQDSVKLAASITVDTVRDIRPSTDTVFSVTDEPQFRVSPTAYSPNGNRCLLTEERARTIVVGDTLSCQWILAVPARSDAGPLRAPPQVTQPEFKIPASSGQPSRGQSP
jgi:hypothetical protein